MKSIKRIKTGVVERTMAVAKVSLKVGKQTAEYSLKKVLGADSDLTKHLIEQAQLLTTELGELKGSMMKAGQMLSVYGERFLPPEVAKVFRALHKETQPVEWRVMRDVIRERLGPERFGKLRFDPEPVGAASLAQVYRAQDLVTDEWLAIKVQYPGIEQAIDNDIRLLKLLLKSARILPALGGTNQWDDVFDEIRTLLQQESDSLREANCAKTYLETFGWDERLAIPKIIDRFTVPGILAMSFEEGLDITETKTLSQPDRDCLGTWILDLFCQELFAYKMVQTDAHFGNFRFRKNADGSLKQLVLLDFGAVKFLPEPFASTYQEAVTGLYAGDRARTLEACFDLGILSGADSPDHQKLFYDFCVLISEPIARDGIFDFGSSDLADRIRSQGVELFKELNFRLPPRDQVWINRKIAGLYTMLAFLGARVDCRALIAPYLNEEEREADLRSAST